MEQRRLRLPIVARGLAPQAIDGPVARGRHDPASGTRRRPARGPPLERSGEGVLHRFFRQADIAKLAYEDGDGAPVFLAKDARDVHVVIRATATAALPPAWSSPA